MSVSESVFRGEASSTSPPMSPSEVEAFAQRLDQHYGRFSALVQVDRELPSPESVQRLMTLAMKLYVAHHERGERFEPVGDDVGATEVAIMCSAMLDAVELEVFELSIWHGLSAETRATERERAGWQR